MLSCYETNQTHAHAHTHGLQFSFLDYIKVLSQIYELSQITDIMSFMEICPNEAPPCPGDISRSPAFFLQENTVDPHSHTQPATLLKGPDGYRRFIHGTKNTYSLCGKLHFFVVFMFLRLCWTHTKELSVCNMARSVHLGAAVFTMNWRISSNFLS